jgi:hypothetical protein
VYLTFKAQVTVWYVVLYVVIPQGNQTTLKYQSKLASVNFILITDVTFLAITAVFEKYAFIFRLINEALFRY